MFLWNGKKNNNSRQIIKKYGLIGNNGTRTLRRKDATKFVFPKLSTADDFKGKRDEGRRGRKKYSQTNGWTDGGTDIQTGKQLNRRNNKQMESECQVGIQKTDESNSNDDETHKKG